MKKLLVASLIGLGLCGGEMALADGTIPITGQGTITYPCTLSNGSAVFGNVNRQSRATQRTSFNVNVDCPIDVPYKVYQSGDGSFTAGSVTLYMNFFKENTYSTHITSSAGYITGTGIGGNQVITIYPELSATPGSYSTIDLTTITPDVAVTGTLTGALTVEF